ncbi:MAG: sodium:proton antiporter [Hyphomicrobiales bacterium]|nr:sodium:proton antiporter [Hyphomicrobiales bacterium]MDE2115842.1 sodium:proton antiporter [Hyphomicrobiales bacterium]
MNVLVSTLVGLLVVAILVAMVTRRLAIPYTVGLVITGVALALTGRHMGIGLTHDVIFDVILPPLLFEAAINIHWKELRRDGLPILTLALIGTIISAAVVAAGMIYILQWPAAPAILFGVLIAATDPVAVIAMFKDNRIEGRLRLLVESESLFNDGVAAVLFSLVLAGIHPAGAQAAPVPVAAALLLSTVGGGILVGAACAGLVLLLAGRTSDHLIESTLTTVAAYGSFLLAEHFQFSGVLATVTAGLVAGNFAVLAEDKTSRFSPKGREFVLALWEFIAFIANSLVFLLIGLTLAGMAFSRLSGLAYLVVIALVLVARALTVYPLCLLFTRSRWAIPLRAQHVLWWGGLRGALGLALALSLPPSLPFRDEILIATFAVVAFSVIVQGLTMPPLLRHAAVVPLKQPLGHK